MNLTCIAVGASGLTALDRLVSNDNETYGWLTTRLHYVGSDSFSRSDWSPVFADLRTSDMVVLDLMGAEREFVEALRLELTDFQGSVVVVNASSRKIRGVAKLGGFSGGMMSGRKRKGSSGGDMTKMLERLEKLGKAVPVGPLRDMRNYLWIGRYWRFASDDNIASMVALIGREYADRSELPQPSPPVTIERAILLDPANGKTWNSFEEFTSERAWREDAPTVALLFSPGTYPANLHPLTAGLIARLEVDFNVLPFAMPRLTGADREFFLSVVGRDAGTSRIDAIINLMGFRLGQGPMGGDAEEAVSVLRDLNVPLLHPFAIAKRTIEAWRDDPRGIKPGEFVLHLFLPELDGAIQTIPIGAVETSDESRFGQISLLDDRVDRLAGKLSSIIRLRRKPRSEKRVAILMYDYPPGEASVGGAAFLDTFGSVAAISGALAAAGYSTEPWSADGLREAIVDGGVLNGVGYSGTRGGVLEESSRLSSRSLPVEIADTISDYWGAAPGTIMVREGKTRLPVIERGNLLVGLQPSRTGEEPDPRSYHDVGIPPHHQYVAFYRWIEEVWKADAIIHVGTHGTLEFLPGKEAATSGSCFPDVLPGNLAHFYVYYCGNPAESMIAKRRSHAVMISHMEPPYDRAGSHGRLDQLHSRLHEYQEAALTDPDRLPSIETDIAESAAEAGIRFEGVHELEDQLLELTSALVPTRLHTVGRGFSPDEAARLIEHIRRADDEGAPVPDASQLTENNELEAIIHALDGGFVEAGPAGDPTRTPDVIPTGRNMFQFDPRLTPTPSATRRGDEIAENTVRTYFEEHGSYPKSVAVVLWGLETAKTHGETVAQILRYLGVRFGPDRSLWESSLELIPGEELGRPRVDVTIQMSGFFRDLFPNLIGVLHDAVDLAASADEGQNAVGVNVERIRDGLLAQGVDEETARELSSVRLFGPHTSEYGTGLTGMVSNSSWDTESDLASHYQQRLKYAYGRNHYGVERGDLLVANLSRVELVSQVRSSRDYEITDLDHFYEFFGGLAQSVRELSGSQATLLVSDTYEGRVRTERFTRAVERGVWSRLVNPAWLDGVLTAAHHGAQEIADRFENMLGLAATTAEVDPTLFDEACDVIVLDDEMRKKVESNNPYALVGIVERLLETNARGYWDASEDRLEALRRIHLELEADLEGGDR